MLFTSQRNQLLWGQVTVPSNPDLEAESLQGSLCETARQGERQRTLRRAVSGQAGAWEDMGKYSARSKPKFTRNRDAKWPWAWPRAKVSLDGVFTQGGSAVPVWLRFSKDRVGTCFVCRAGTLLFLMQHFCCRTENHISQDCRVMLLPSVQWSRDS